MLDRLGPFYLPFGQLISLSGSGGMLVGFVRWVNSPLMQVGMRICESGSSRAGWWRVVNLVRHIPEDPVVPIPQRA